MFKKIIVFTLLVMLMLIPERTYAAEEMEEETAEPGSSDEVYNEEPYVEPWAEEPYIEPWTEEPSVEPWIEEPYVEPWYDDTYEEPDYYNDNQNDTYNEQPVPYEEPYTEEIEELQPFFEPEPEIEVTPESPELSISTVGSEHYNVSGTIVGDEVTEGILLILTSEDERKETTSDKDGTFVFTDVPNGTYSLSAEDSGDYEMLSEPIDVTVDNRNKLGYEIALEKVEPELEPEEDLPIESAETDERSEEADRTTISGFELALILTGTILLLIAIAIVLFRKFSSK